jgi:acetylornithine deacetylase/succinyl-diaminopimelate desuccinylase-like protein
LTDYLEEATSLLARLVAHRSVQGQEAIRSCLVDLAREFERYDPKIEWHEFDGVPNLLVHLNPELEAPRLIFAGHVDVVDVQENWCSDPWSLTERRGRLYGRGATDMKGGIAAFAGALRLLDATEGLDELPTSLILTGDEEVGSAHGMVRLLEEGFVKATWAICGEPTGLEVFLGNRGLVWMSIRVRGRGGHAGMSHALDSPVPWAAKVALALEEIDLPVTHPLFDPPFSSLTVTGMDAGTSLGAPNVIPDEVRIVIDRRLLPGEVPEEAVSRVKDVIGAVLPRSIGWDLEILRTWPPYVISEDSPLVAVAREAVRRVGRPGRLGADPAADDSSWLGDAGIATVLLGPGEPVQAHASDESVSRADLRDAVLAYATILQEMRTGALG